MILVRALTKVAELAEHREEIPRAVFGLERELSPAAAVRVVFDEYALLAFALELLAEPERLVNLEGVGAEDDPRVGIDDSRETDADAEEKEPLAPGKLARAGDEP